jgi:hypothetical protein
MAKGLAALPEVYSFLTTAIGRPRSRHRLKASILHGYHVVVVLQISAWTRHRARLHLARCHAILEKRAR